MGALGYYSEGDLTSPGTNLALRNHPQPTENCPLNCPAITASSARVPPNQCHTHSHSQKSVRHVHQ
jgi:hypothetical protein